MLRAIRTGRWLTLRRACVYAALVAVIGLAALLANWALGAGTVGANGKTIGTDFAGMWTAGRLVLEGRAADAFSPELHFAYQREVLPNPMGEVYGWHYPPFFLAIAAILALFPYLVALAIWQSASLALYIWAMRRIAPPTTATMWLLIGFPAVFVTLGHGHNAFLTAALIGLGLHSLKDRPLLAGLCLGLLAYKPQFGLVLPVVLLAGGHWRAFTAAAATVAAMTAAVTLWLGPGVWTAFISEAAFTRDVILEQGVTGWHKIQSLFSAARSLGAPVELAYLLQGALTISVIAITAFACARRADQHDSILALTCIAALIATPYALDYDMMILAPALAFAARRTLATPPDDWEISLYALVWITPLIARNGMMLTGVPISVLVMLAFFVFTAHRVLRAPPVAHTPHWPRWPRRHRLAAPGAG